jgi:hypothetical protein
MTSRTRRALASALACILVTATGSAVLAGPITPDDLTGTWDWTQTIYYFQGIKTPETEGYTLTLVMRSDGTYDLLRGGVLDQSGTWRLSDETSACGSPQSLWIENLITERSRVNLDSDVLVFGMLCLDLPEYYFERHTEVGTHDSSWSALKANSADAAVKGTGQRPPRW